MSEYRVTSQDLLNSLIDMTGLAIFWKDSQRRFLGANKRFLNFYGFDSVEDIIGKTDEDMGWHVDPEPFHNDELRVLRDGEEIHDANGTCIADGKIHDILATKVPIRRDDKIIGLVGYFRELTTPFVTLNDTREVPLTDSLTNLLNTAGIMYSLQRFRDSYQRLGSNFCIAVVRIGISGTSMTPAEDIAQDQLRLAVTAVLDRYFGKVSCTGINESGDYAVMQQYNDRNEVNILEHNLRRALSRIHEIGDHEVTLDVRVASATIDESDADLSKLCHLAESRL